MGSHSGVLEVDEKPAGLATGGVERLVPREPRQNIVRRPEQLRERPRLRPAISRTPTAPARTCEIFTLRSSPGCFKRFCSRRKSRNDSKSGTFPRRPRGNGGAATIGSVGTSCSNSGRLDEQERKNLFSLSPLSTYRNLYREKYEHRKKRTLGRIGARTGASSSRSGSWDFLESRFRLSRHTPSSASSSQRLRVRFGALPEFDFPARVAGASAGAGETAGSV